METIPLMRIQSTWAQLLIVAWSFTCLFLTGCDQTRTEWTVQTSPAGICGLGINTRWQAEWRSLENTASGLSLIMADPLFWERYFNTPHDKNPVTLKDIRITPGRLTADQLAECHLSFHSVDEPDADALRTRLIEAISRYVADDRRARELDAIADLKVREAAMVSKEDEESRKLLAIIRMRLAEAQSQLLDNDDHFVLKVFIDGD
ncbi:MAG: hypothetical protein ABII82_20695 [Verrucomicrobiota bacterium]